MDLNNYSQYYPEDTTLIKSDDQWDVIHLKSKNEDEFNCWLKKFEHNSGIVFRKSIVRRRQCVQVQYYARYRCQHNTRPGKNVKYSKLHTGCRAQMHVTIYTFNKQRRGHLQYRNEFRTVVKFYKPHNHLPEAVKTTHFREVDGSLKLKFSTMFKKHIGPMSALRIHHLELLEEHGAEYDKMCTDRSLCPDYNWVLNFYRSTFKEEGNTFEKLQEQVKSISEKGNECRFAFQFFGNDFVVALCTPLMERVHKLDNSKHVVFVDRSEKMDRCKCRVFLLKAYSNIGGLPLGILISSSDAANILTAGFELLQQVLPEYCFGGNGHPEYIMTDDVSAVYASLQIVFSKSKIWFCTFHILQSTWRWLWNKNHEIAIPDRLHLFKLFKKVVYASSDEEHKRAVTGLQSDAVLRKNLLFHNYMNNLMRRDDLWSRSYGLLTGDSHSYNILEVAVWTLKDKVLAGVQAYSIVQLYEFLTESLSSYYENKISAICDGSHNPQARYMPTKMKMQSFKVEKIDEDQYKAKNELNGMEYYVNVTISHCSCLSGVKGAPCKHQHAVCRNIVQNQDTVPLNENEEMTYNYIALGGPQFDSNDDESMIDEHSDNIIETPVDHFVENASAGMQVVDVVEGVISVNESMNHFVDKTRENDPRLNTSVASVAEDSSTERIDNTDNTVDKETINNFDYIDNVRQSSQEDDVTVTSAKQLVDTVVVSTGKLVDNYVNYTIEKSLDNIAIVTPVNEPSDETDSLKGDPLDYYVAVTSMEQSLENVVIITSMNEPMHLVDSENELMDNCVDTYMNNSVENVIITCTNEPENDMNTNYELIGNIDNLENVVIITSTNEPVNIFYDDTSTDKRQENLVSADEEVITVKLDEASTYINSMANGESSEMGKQ